ncbi:MAG: glycosyltransferase family 39 protein [Elusimicrobia bacterium]|nr:glycosyltransferase family 39 protein [Elusimicrobiota bacterium]
MKFRLNWVLSALTAASYAAYPVWRLPLPWPAQWALLNLFLLLSAALLYTSLDEVELQAPAEELRELWPVAAAAAAVCLPFWLLPLPTGSDAQSHAGPAAWLLGRLTSAAGLNIRLLPLFSVPALLLAIAAVRKAPADRFVPGRGTAAIALLAAGNIYFLADLRWGIAGAIGRFETVLRYPPLSKFLYFPAYALLGVNEAAPRLVQFLFMTAAAAYMLRTSRLLGSGLPRRLSFLLVLFFPTFFNLAISAELEAGTVLFFAAAIYHFLAAVDGDRKEFLKCAFWTAAGFFYKQLLLGLLLSFLPALAALAIFLPDRREKWLYGLKTLAIPAALGLPFITISTLTGIRNTALQAANLLSPRLMTLDLIDLYRTSGAAITALLAASAAFSVMRRRSVPLWLLLYFTAAYYVMISASAAVGYVRHAQPFYIGLAVLVLPALSALSSKLKGQAGRLLPYAALALFAWQAMLAKDPYQRKTAFNFAANVYPYSEAARYLRPGQSVYAPMEVEPSHFYLAKYGLAGKVRWDRDLPPGLDAGRAEARVADGRFDYLLLPGTNIPGIDADFRGITAALLSSGKFEEERTFDYSGNRLLLLRYVRNTGTD